MPSCQTAGWMDRRISLIQDRLRCPLASVLGRPRAGRCPFAGGGMWVSRWVPVGLKVVGFFGSRCGFWCLLASCWGCFGQRGTWSLRDLVRLPWWPVGLSEGFFRRRKLGSFWWAGACRPHRGLLQAGSTGLLSGWCPLASAKGFFGREKRSLYTMVSAKRRPVLRRVP